MVCITYGLLNGERALNTFTANKPSSAVTYSILRIEETGRMEEKFNKKVGEGLKYN